MVKLRKKFEKSLIALLKDLNTQELREAADYVLFLKTRSVIDPAQAYFWTSQWQKMEKHVESDKRRGHILGKSSVDSLLLALNP